MIDQLAKIKKPEITLADSATVAIDAGKGDKFFLSGSVGRTFGIPTNLTAGQVLLISWKNTGASPISHTLTTSGTDSFRFLGSVNALPATAAGATDSLIASYNAVDSRLDVLGISGLEFPKIGYEINVQALTSSPTDAQTIYFGVLPKAPTTTAAISKVYLRKAALIKRAEIYCYSGTAGTNESWSIYIRVNNTTDYLIATLAVSTSERVFSNTALNISLAAGDYFEIKSVNPTWATNPLTTIFGGRIYVEEVQ